MTLRSLTSRWVLYCLGIPISILMIIGAGIAFLIQNYYYTSTNQFIDSSVRTVSSLINRYSQDSARNLDIEIRSLIETYSQKEKIELMGIDYKGQVIITSSGFNYSNEKMPDYTDALKGAEGRGEYVGVQKNGEKIMAVCIAVPSVESKFTALRFVVSLKMVDRTIISYNLIVVGVVLVILMFISFSGMYFIRSIVKPVKEIKELAQNIASGDMKTRIVKKSDDEIGDLCDTINFMAEELSKTEKIKNDFMSSVSHELRTPLTAIKGWSETIKSTSENNGTEIKGKFINKEDEKLLQTGVNIIITETERLSEMVEELLDFSRMQAGRFELNMARLDILAELLEAILIYRERAKSEGKKLKYDEPEMLPFVFGDKNRLKQVFINIIDNAIKYSDEGAIISARAEEENEYIKITVADTGYGIREEDLPFIKQKFYKGNHTKRGSGIGLAVANEIISMHSGELIIESEINIGTIVTIKLPVYKDDQTEDMKIKVNETISQTIL